MIIRHVNLGYRLFYELFWLSLRSLTENMDPTRACPALTIASLDVLQSRKGLSRSRSRILAFAPFHLDKRVVSRARVFWPLPLALSTFGNCARDLLAVLWSKIHKSQLDGARSSLRSFGDLLRRTCGSCPGHGKMARFARERRRFVGG
jgi:hypothetical protein